MSDRPVASILKRIVDIGAALLKALIADKVKFSKRPGGGTDTPPR